MNRIGPKNNIEDIKHLKIQHLFKNSKNTDFKNLKWKKYTVDPCLCIWQVHPPGMYIAEIGQAVLELLSFKVRSGNQQRGISLLQKVLVI